MKAPLRPADRALWEVASPLKKGEFSRAVRTQHGYHIVKVDDVEGRQDVKLEDVRDDVLKAIYQAKRQEYFRSWYVKLLERSDVRKMLAPPAR